MEENPEYQEETPPEEPHPDEPGNPDPEEGRTPTTNGDGVPMDDIEDPAEGGTEAPTG